MKLSLGIVGLPNVGKSTLFNALTANSVPAENYPFCTIDPNVGIVPVIDPRLDSLAELVKPKKVTPAVVEFWDIAGLVKGAAGGAGLGNKFLANIRSVSAIVHLVRAFENKNITHVEERIDPKRDIEIINAELILKDLDTVNLKLQQLEGRARADRSLIFSYEQILGLSKHLDSGKLASDYKLPTDESVAELVNSMFLLTNKPVLYVINCPDSIANDAIDLVRNAVEPSAQIMTMDVKLESEIAALPASEQKLYLSELGIVEPSLARLTREVYNLLGLISFFTAGEQEVRAWTITNGMKAPQAAGTIHTDFERKFITADIVKFEDFILAGGWNEAKEQGKVKLGGKDYTMCDGDVVLFRHNA